MGDEPLVILLADDHPLFRAGLKHLLAGLDEKAHVCEASDLEQALERLSGHASVDLMLVDLIMPGMNGFSGIQRLCEQAPDVPLVVISVKESAEDVRRAMRAGAVGYIPKSSLPDVMIGALRLVLSGGMYLPPNVLEGLGAESGDGGRRRQGEGSESGPLANLTRRQRDVLDLLVEGKSNKDIAGVLGLSPGTVKIHVSSIFKALNVTNRTQAVIMTNELLRQETVA